MGITVSNEMNRKGANIEKSPLENQFENIPHFSPANIDSLWLKLDGVPGENISELEPVGNIGFRKRYRNGTIYFHSTKFTCAFVTGLLCDHIDNQNLDDNKFRFPITDSCSTGDGGLVCATSDENLLFVWENDGPHSIPRQLTPTLLGILDGKDPNGSVTGNEIMVCAGGISITKPDHEKFAFKNEWTVCLETLAGYEVNYKHRSLQAIIPYGAIFFAAIFCDNLIEKRDRVSTLMNARVETITDLLNDAMTGMISTELEKHRVWYDPSFIEVGSRLLGNFSSIIKDLVQQAFIGDPSFVGINTTFLMPKEMVKLYLKVPPGLNFEKEFSLSVNYLNGLPGKYDVLFCI